MTAREALEALLAGVELADLDDLLGRPGWHVFAACAGAGPDVFFETEPESLDAARRVCRRCPVAVECGQAGLTERYGVWGGLTPAERRRARRNRSVA